MWSRAKEPVPFTAHSQTEPSRGLVWDVMR